MFYAICVGWSNLGNKEGIGGDSTSAQKHVFVLGWPTDPGNTELCNLRMGNLISIKVVSEKRQNVSLAVL